MAVRPFVTDDARVVGYHVGQLESSARFDKDDFINLNLLAFGPTENWELTLGFTNGFPLSSIEPHVYSGQGPLMQVKYLFWESKPNAYPGLAVVVGGTPPMGWKAYKPDTWREFTYIAMTQSLGNNEAVLIHGNLGLSTSGSNTVATWGIGTQVHLFGGLNGIFEVFYNDPYGGDNGGAFQTGFRYFISEKVQLDMTGGTGLWGNPHLPAYYGAGIRIVTDRLW